MRTRHIDFEQLSRLSGFEDPEAVGRWLRREGVSFALDADARPWTTIQAIQRCLRRRAEQARYPYADIALEF
jgi:hypothetical protein